MKKFYKIEDFIDTTSNAFALKGTSPLSADATEVTMCSSSNVLEEIEQSFGERSVYIKETDTPFVDFTAMWARWLLSYCLKCFFQVEEFLSNVESVIH